VPQALREQLGLAQGSRVRFKLVGNHIDVRPCNTSDSPCRWTSIQPACCGRDRARHQCAGSLFRGRGRCRSRSQTPTPGRPHPDRIGPAAVSAQDRGAGAEVGAARLLRLLCRSGAAGLRAPAVTPHHQRRGPPRARADGDWATGRARLRRCTPPLQLPEMRGRGVVRRSRFWPAHPPPQRGAAGVCPGGLTAKARAACSALAVPEPPERRGPRHNFFPQLLPDLCSIGRFHGLGRWPVAIRNRTWQGLLSELMSKSLAAASILLGNPSRTRATHRPDPQRIRAKPSNRRDASRLAPKIRG